MPVVPGPSKPVDWAAIDRYLARECGFTPQQVDKMTLSEIVTLCEDGKPVSMSDAEMRSELERWARMTPREKLMEAKQ